MQPRKPEILFFPFDLLSHYTRSLELAKEYRSDYHIYFKNSSKYSDLIRENAYDTFDCKDFDAEYVNTCMRKFNFKWLNYNDLEYVLNSQIEAIERIRPAMVIGDMSPTLSMACEKTNTKFVSLINGYMSKYYSLERPVGETHPAYFIKKIIPAEIFSKVAAKQEKKAFEKIHQPFNKLRSKIGLKKKTSYLDELEGDETLICDHESIFPLRGQPTSYRYVGPLLATGDQSAEGAPLNADNKKTIIVTMGSSGEWKKLSSLNDPEFSKYHFIVLGDKDRILNAEHFQHFDFVDLRSVLSRSDLVICHGGNGTMNYCFDMKLPFIALPSMIEQEWNALRFKDLMKGVILSRRPTSSKLSATIDSLIDQ